MPSPVLDGQETGPIRRQYVAQVNDRVRPGAAGRKSCDPEPMVTDTPALYTDRSEPPKLYATPDPITGKRRDRVVIRTEDLDEETLALLLNVEPGARSKALNYLMDETETDRG